MYPDILLRNSTCSTMTIHFTNIYLSHVSSGVYLSNPCSLPFPLVLTLQMPPRSPSSVLPPEISLTWPLSPAPREMRGKLCIKKSDACLSLSTGPGRSTPSDLTARTDGCRKPTGKLCVRKSWTTRNTHVYLYPGHTCGAAAERKRQQRRKRSERNDPADIHHATVQ